MKIIIAQTAGFCMGVRRAVDLAVDSPRGPHGKIYTIGPLIHNNQTLQMLSSRGIEELSEDRSIDPADPVLIRAHGIPPALEQQYTQRGHMIIDGTCPKVKTVHKVIAKYRSLGYAIVITGDEGHAEVIGLMGYAGEGCHLVQSVEDIDTLPWYPKICLVSQTTFDRTLFDSIANKIRERFSQAELVIRKTICAATDRRQEEISELARTVDAMIIVGGRNSANTLRLAKIARQHNANIQHIETEKEINWEVIAGCATLGITAGASTPNWMIKRVVDQLRFLEQTRSRTIRNRLLQVLDNASNLNFLVAVGAGAMYLSSCMIQGIPIHLRGAVLAILYMFSMYLWNTLANLSTTNHLGLSRFRYYSAHKPALWVLSITSIFIMGIFSLQSGRKPLFSLMTISILAGTLYYFPMVPKAFSRFFKYSTLKDIPTSRDLFVALAWSILITFIPQAMQEQFNLDLFSLTFFIFMFAMAFIRSLIYDLRDIEGDRIMGRETLVTLIGEQRVRRGIKIALVLLCSLIGAVYFYTVFNLKSIKAGAASALALQVLTVGYIAIFMHWSKNLNQRHPVIFNLLSDLQFIISGSGAFLGNFLWQLKL